MTQHVSRTIYENLRNAIQTFVAETSASGLDPFKANISGTFDAWIEAEVSHLPAADFLPPALAATTPQTEPLTRRFEHDRHALKWEQSYTRSDQLVGDDMLHGYGFVEVVGKNGPFLSTTVRTGIGVWGPDIDYPVHNHKAEEVYVPLAGHAEFTLDGSPYQARHAGEIVHVPSNMRHGFRTTTQPFVVLYIWQDGDLREKSTFH